MKTQTGLAVALLVLFSTDPPRIHAQSVGRSGHCNFTPAQTGGAFDALLAWARDGKHPTAGEQK